MLTKEQYETLRTYRDVVVPASKTIDETTARLAGQKFIALNTLEYTVRQECDVTYQKSVWVLTSLGRLALEEFEEHQAQILENRLWQAAGITIGLLTLGATIIFGLLTLLR